MHYLDNAATSWPKPEAVYRAMDRFSREIGGSPGRSAHRRSIAAARIVLEARENTARLLGVSDPMRVVFTKNATEALNLAILGLLSPGDHAVTSSIEHNSVMRPLRFLEENGVEITAVRCSPQGELDPADVAAALRKNTRAVFLTHASNVAGAILPIAEIGRITRERGVVLGIDAAQTAGAVPLSAEEAGIDLLAFTGHKSMFGPQGTGGLFIGTGLESRLHPLLRGGTGSRSEHEEQPDFLPDKFESGTPNTVGLAGLAAGTGFLLEQGVETIRRHEEILTGAFLDGLRSIPGITVYGPLAAARRIPVVALNVKDLSPAEAALALDERFGILTRPGLHCAPAAHRVLGTFPGGAVRFAFGFFNTADDVTAALEALQELAGCKT
ncbi:MAG: cysteine desulfurase [Deltaproteobacteria bacterium HGW-Deltaproteobacteria-19]|nr:MAG: cysteine desulfurase [Deltaproteobacteria bacterium HGW-Deltaproteobacteria-19]